MSLPNSQDNDPKAEDGQQSGRVVPAPVERQAQASSVDRPTVPAPSRANEPNLVPDLQMPVPEPPEAGERAEPARGSTRRPLRTVLAWGAAGILCLVIAVLLQRGCGHPPAIQQTPQMGIEARFWVRVLLLSNKTECTIEMPSAFEITSVNVRSGKSTNGTTREPLAEPTKISLAAGRLLLGTEPLAGKEIIFSPEQPCIFGLENEQFRGQLKLIVNEDGRSFDAINLVPLEPYLAGVVGREMKNDWELQALEAQAVAARTYCLFTKNRYGTNHSYDIRRTQANQVYGGVAAESPRVWEAVNRTCGQVLVTPEIPSEQGSIADSVGSGDPQSYKLFPAYYSSTCGGHTTRSDQVLGDSYGPLRGVPCPYCKDTARLDRFYWPMVTFDRETVTKQLVKKYPKLVELGEITGLAVIGESSYESFSRLTRIRVTGTTGKTDTLRAEDLRLSLDPSGAKIKSAACKVVPWGKGWAFVSGRGWGHGVGMCQYGAKGMADLGNDAGTILRYYYPGAEIVNVY